VPKFLLLSFCYRLLGKEFVFGCRNGIVHKVDITYHEPRVSHCWSPSLSRESEENFSITALDWVNYEFKKKQMDIVRLLFFEFCMNNLSKMTVILIGGI
jgi:hypothetical protein